MIMAEMDGCQGRLETTTICDILYIFLVTWGILFISGDNEGILKSQMSVGNIFLHVVVYLIDQLPDLK